MTIGVRRDFGGRTPVILLGGGITGLGAQRTLRRAGVPSYLAGEMQPLNLRSRWYQALPVAGPDAPADLVPWLDRLPLDRAVLLPCSDSWAFAVASLDARVRDRFPSSVPGAEAIHDLVDKGRFAARLRELDIPHPRSVVVDDVEDLDGIDLGDFRGAFLKPRDSQRFWKEFGVKALHVTSPGEGRRLLERITARGHRVMVQEYVPGPPSYHYFIDGFFDRDGAVKALFARQRLRMYPPSFGNSSFMRTVPVEDVQSAADAVVLLLSSLGYRGMFSAEFKLDPRDARYKILEVNARAWWYVEFAARCGVDVCGMAYRDALGEEVPGVGDYAVGKTLAYPYSDFFACLQQHRDGRLRPWAWARSWLGAMQPVLHPLDPWPALAGGGQVLGGWLGRRLRGLFSGPSDAAT